MCKLYPLNIRKFQTGDKLWTGSKLKQCLWQQNDGSEILPQHRVSSLKYHHLQSVQSTMSCLSLVRDHVLCVPGPPLFGKSSVEEETHTAAGWTLLALPFISSSLRSHQHCWDRAHFSWFCHHPWGSKFNFVYTSEEVCASAGWADNRCRLFSALVVVLQFCITLEPLLGGAFETEARCKLVFPVVGNADISKSGFLFDSEPA